MLDYTVFVGVDISAKSATVSWGTQANDLCKPRTIKQNDTDWQWLSETLRSLTDDPKKCLIVMEATGTYWMQMALVLHEAGFTLVSIRKLPYSSKCERKRIEQEPANFQLSYTNARASCAVWQASPKCVQPPTVGQDIAFHPAQDSLQ